MRALNIIYISEVLGHSLTLVGIMFIYIKIPLHKFLYIIEKELLLKFFIYTFISIFLLAFGYFNFNPDKIIEHFLYFAILNFLCIIGLFATIKRIFFYTNKVPAQLHDVRNILMGLSISVHSTSDSQKIKKEVDTSLTILGINSVSKSITLDDYHNSITTFINQKKQIGHSHIKFVTDIKYLESHINITLSAILYMLGVLIDNAIESGTKKPIYINVSITEESLLISVANEYRKKSEDEFQKMFQDGYSTKQKQGRGHGLANLSKFVRLHGGEIGLNHKYKEEGCEYLTISIFIGN